MQAHCNFIEEMDSISDMNNLEKLRDLVQNEAYKAQNFEILWKEIVQTSFFYHLTYEELL